jgi:hypothetical protein
MKKYRGAVFACQGIFGKDVAQDDHCQKKS